MKEPELISVSTDSVLRIDTNPYKPDSAVIEEVVIPTFKLLPETSHFLDIVSPEFDFANPPVDPNEFASSLVETCRKHKAFGLAANQCGFPYRVFVMGNNDEYVAFFNPKIVAKSEDTVKDLEGCLSFPELYLHVDRAESVTVEYQDFTGAKKLQTFTGLTARVFQHEFDHLNGIKFTSSLKPLALKMARERQAKTLKQKQRASNKNGKSKR